MCLELNLALVILSLIGDQLMINAAAFFDIMMATLCIYTWSSLLEYTTVSPVLSRVMTEPFHVLSLIPNISMFALLVSLVI